MILDVTFQEVTQGFSVGFGTPIAQPCGVLYTPQSLTEEQKSQARENIGAADNGNVSQEKQYELIEDFTLTEDVASINRKEAPDGRAYNFSAVRILVEAQPVTGGSSTSQLIFALYGNNVSASATIYHQVNNGLNSSARATSFVARNDCGFIEFYSVNASAIDSADAFKSKPYAVVKPWENVQRINFGRYPTSLVIPAGTRIQIYGIWG